MRLEHLPLILGVLVALLGAGLVYDALTPDGTVVGVERRRRARAPRHPRGELLVGLGVLAIAAALIGRDVWRYGTLAVLAGLILLTAGALLNRHYLRELFMHRGALSRTDEGLPLPGTRTERVVRKPVVPEAPASGTAGLPGAAGTPAAPGAPAAPTPVPERRAKPRGGDGPRRVR